MKRERDDDDAAVRHEQYGKARRCNVGTIVWTHYTTPPTVGRVTAAANLRRKERKEEEEKQQKQHEYVSSKAKDKEKEEEAVGEEDVYMYGGAKETHVDDDKLMDVIRQNIIDNAAQFNSAAVMIIQGYHEHRVAELTHIMREGALHFASACRSERAQREITPALV